MHGEINFMGQTTFSSSPIINGESLSVTSNPFIGSFVGTELRNELLFSKIGNDITGQTGAYTDNFGASVDMSADGSRIVIGARNHDTQGNNNRGLVQIFEFSNLIWNQLGTDIIGSADNEYLGTSVSISANGTRIAIGAEGFRVGDGNGFGKVSVYDYNYLNQLILVGSAIVGEFINNNFGSSVKLSGDGTTLIVGATGYDSSKGRVSVYLFDQQDWNQVGTYFVGSSYDNLPNSVDISYDGNVIAFSTYLAYKDTIQTGAAYVYQNISGTWMQRGDTLYGTVNGEKFGTSIALSRDGTKLICGSLTYDGNNGKVSSYRYYDSKWVSMGDLYDNSADGFGTSISCSDDGLTIVVGSSNKVQIYQHSNGLWNIIGQYIDGAYGDDGFGASTSISSTGSNIVVGCINSKTNFRNYVRNYKLDKYSILPHLEPMTPSAGTMYFSEDTLYIYDGSGWKSITLA